MESWNFLREIGDSIWEDERWITYNSMNIYSFIIVVV
jgi:hypothetical protein